VRVRAIVTLFVLCAGLRAVALVRTSAQSDDEAIYAVVAREMLAGRTLYRDVVDHKPPLIYVTYAATQALGGPRGGMVLVHALTLLAVFATALALRRLAGDVAAVLWCVFSTTMIDFDALAANCELFMELPLVLSVAAYLAGRRFLAGALVGAAMLYKYQAGIHLPLYALHLAWRARRGYLAAWCALAAGAAAVMAAAVAVLWATGALPAALFWLRFNAGYIASGMAPLELLARAAARIAIVVGGAALLYVLGARGAWRAVCAGTPFERFACWWLVASAVAVCAGGRFYGHYFHQLTAPLAVLAAPGAAALLRARPVLSRALIAVPAAGFVVAGALHARVMTLIGQPDPDYSHMAAVVRSLAGPDDSVCIWGNLPVLYFEAERPLGCRFVFANYLTGMSPATATQYDPDADASANIVPEAWDMLEADFAARRPRLVLDASYGDVANYGKFPPAKFPRLAAMLARDYRPVAIVDGVRVLARRSTTSSAGTNTSAAASEVASPRIDAAPNERMPWLRDSSSDP
jgi:hypothetical protein